MDLTFWLELVLFVVLLVFSGFFSSSETALFSLSSLQLDQMTRDGNSRVDLIKRMLSEPRRLIVTILIGNEFVNVSASVLSAAMVIQVFGADNKLFNLFIMIPILLVFGEITPKTLAIRNNVAFATFESGPIDLFAKLIAPIRWAVRTVSDWFTTLIVGKERSPGNIVTADMVRTLAHDAVGKGALDKSEAQYIDQIFELGDKTLEDILTPRAEIDFIPSDISITELLQILKETRRSRLPVYGESRDNILGILHTRDLLDVELKEFEGNQKKFIGLLRDAYFVPESKLALELFNSFRDTKRSFTLTVDEYGGVTGLVTMEDLLECIFGDIPSPSDAVEQFEIQKLEDNRYSVDGAMPLDDFNRHLESRLSAGEMETLGGFVLHAFGELPAEGETITIQGFKFTASKVAQNRIALICVEPPPQPGAGETDDGTEPSEPTTGDTE